MAKDAAPKTDESEFYKRFGIRVYSPDALKETLKLNIAARLPTGIIGKAGTGKTSIVHQVAEELDMDVHVLYLQHLDKEDLSGFPFPDDRDSRLVTMRMRRLVPLERSKRKGTILLLDEANRADKPVLNATFTLMEQPRRLGDTVLPDDVHIVICINPNDGLYAVNEMENDPAFRRRVIWTGMMYNHGSFLKYAEKMGFHRGVISFIRRHKQHLYDTEGHNMGRVCATPASWEKVSQIIKAAEKLTGGDLDKVGAPLRVSVEGIIGNERAHEFMTELLNDDAALIEPEEILVADFGPGNDAYERVEKLAKSRKNGISGRIGDMCMSLATTVAMTQPAPVVASPAVAKFMGLLAGDNLQKFIESLLSGIQEHDKEKKYLRAFTSVLKEQPEYVDAMKRLSGASSKIAGAIAGNIP